MNLNFFNARGEVFMQVAALVVAAGMSSRMGDFKPMLNIGSISIAKRVVSTFQQAGVNKIVVITGHNATILEKHLSNMGLIFLRNENYQTTDMFTSARIGLDYLKDKCDRILFTPVDIPLFTADTVKKIIDSGYALACPVCDGLTGHPIMIDSGLVDAITTDSGEGGLKGALSRCGEKMGKIEVEDFGILHDADTPEDYASLLKFHNSQLIRPVVSISLVKETPFFDKKAYMLLMLTDETGSVATACQRMQISYSSGWNIIKNMELQFKKQLIERTQGGNGGGESHLTEYGREFLKCYEAFETDLKSQADSLFEKYFGGII